MADGGYVVTIQSDDVFAEEWQGTFLDDAIVEAKRLSGVTDVGNVVHIEEMPSHRSVMVVVNGDLFERHNG